MDIQRIADFIADTESRVMATHVLADMFDSAKRGRGCTVDAGRFDYMTCDKAALVHLRKLNVYYCEEDACFRPGDADA
jgi:hypothetical protein